MIDPSTVQWLNRLLAIVSRSFPQYLRYSRPYIPPGRDNVVETLKSIVTDQDALAARVSQMLIDAHAPLRTGEFPMDYTDKHDLGIDFLCQAAVAFQEQDIASIAVLVERLQTAPAAKSLAEEALGMAKGHLDSLQELVAETVAN
ncbi:MAG: hypothetical protein KDA57_12670 [Planctomycetales bacterium]|nr:hypothetical protein [Planctomycetales bacterium]